VTAETRTALATPPAGWASFGPQSL
jgi:hypothetical protein